MNEKKKVPWYELTHMFSQSSALSEMEKKYSNSFLILKTNSSKIIAKYIKFKDGFYLFKDKFNNMLQIGLETNVEVLIPQVTKGLYQCGPVCLFGSYTAYRQYRKSINCESFQVTEPFYETSYEVDTLMFNYLDQNYPNSYEKAIELVTQEYYMSVAINKQFGIIKIHPSGYSTKYFLFYMDVVIGEIDIIKKEIKIHLKEFNQEVMDSTRTIAFGDYNVVYE